MSRIAVLVVALVLAAAGTTSAQATNFSGDWKLNVASSEFGGMPAPSSMTQKVTHAEPSLKVVSSQVSDFGAIDSDFTFTTDGTECVNKVMDFTLKSTLKWEGPVLVINSTMDFQGSPATMVDKWALSADGTQIIVSRHFEGPMGAGDGKLVFEKQ
jgi:hypothetical protein